MSEPLYIEGDLNTNIMFNENRSLESVAGYRFFEFIKNLTTGEIRIILKLNVLISNHDNITKCCSISCPLLDNKFLTAAA